MKNTLLGCPEVLVHSGYLTVKDIIKLTRLNKRINNKVTSLNDLYQNCLVISDHINTNILRNRKLYIKYHKEIGYGDDIDLPEDDEEFFHYSKKIIYLKTYTFGDCYQMKLIFKTISKINLKPIYNDSHN